MKRIKLTNGDFVVVDDKDYEELSKYNWRYQRGYAVRTDNSTRPPKSVYMHREVLDAPKGMDVDHINMLRADNRQENLRLVTRSQNMANTMKNRKGLSKYKGVSMLKRPNLKKPWLAYIKLDYKMIHLGYFATEQEAALAYNAKAKEIFGDSAQLNIVD